VVEQGAGQVIQKRVQLYREEMHERILDELSREKKDRGLKHGLRSASCSELVLNLIWGIFVTIRLSGSDPSVGNSAAKAMVQTMQDWLLD
jgi:hypothetical protein